MRVLVTGGAGFIGSHSIDRLLERGHFVRVIDALDPQVHPGGTVPGYLSGEVDLRVADVRDREAMVSALEGMDAVLHLAAAVGVGQSMYEIQRYTSVNDLGAAVLLEAVTQRSSSVSRLVVASSMSIYGEGAYLNHAGTMVYPGIRPPDQLARREWEFTGHDGTTLRPVPTPESKPLTPTSVYAVNKRTQEELFLAVGRSYGIPTLALRYFNVYGPRQALSNPYTGVAAIFASRLLNGRTPLVFEDGLQSRDFVYVTDVARANVLALESHTPDSAVMNIGSGQSVTILQVAQALAGALGVGSSSEVTHQYRTGDIRHCFGDISLARDHLGFEPEVTLREGMELLVQWLREQHAEDRVEAASQELTRRGLLR